MNTIHPKILLVTNAPGMMRIPRYQSLDTNTDQSQSNIFHLKGLKVSYCGV